LIVSDGHCKVRDILDLFLPLLNILHTSHKVLTHCIYSYNRSRRPTIWPGKTYREMGERFLGMMSSTLQHLIYL
jgi:hypothetical protein